MAMMMLSLAIISYGLGDYSTEVTYNVTDNYVIEIPTSVSANGGSMSIVLSGKQSNTAVTVSVHSANRDLREINQWCLTNEHNSTIGYQISTDFNTISGSDSNDQVIGHFYSNGKIDLFFSLFDDRSTFSPGHYSDQLTFHIS